MQNVVKLFSPENPSALIDRAELTECVALLAKLCGGKQALPILSHIRIASEPGGVAFTASTQDMQVETSLSADVDARFSAALPAAALLKLMKKGTPSPTAILELMTETEDDRFIPERCAVQLNGTRFIIDAQPTDGFPDPIQHRAGDKVQRFSIASAVLWNAIDGTKDAASTDEARPYLRGMHVHSHHGRLRFVATDGHRLYIQDTNIQTGKSDLSAIVPAAAVEFVATLIDGHAGADPVQVEISETVAVVVFRDIAVTTKLIEGSFPDYQRVIPAELDKSSTIAAGELSAAVSSLVECTGAETISLTFGSETLTIAAAGAAGQGSTEIACTYAGDDIAISFDAKKLRSTIEAASPDGRNLIIRMSSPSSAAIITGSIGGWTGVMMPTEG